MKLKDFLTLKVGAGVLISGTRYNPLINYDWSTTTTSGLRYLKDVGSIPTYDASMYFGRGAYFNGVDQRLENVLLKEPLEDIGVLCFRANPSILKTAYIISNAEGSARFYVKPEPSGWLVGLADTIINTGIIPIVGKAKDIILAWNNDTFTLSVGNDSYTNTYTGSCAGIYKLTVSSSQRYTPTYFGGVLKDISIFNRALTQSEIAQFYEQPEAFYAMAQADSTCVLNMPMCETDEYARNMKSYSEGSELVTVVNGYGKNTVTKTNDVYTLTVIDDIKGCFAAIPNVLIDDKVLISYEIISSTATTGSIYSWFGSTKSEPIATFSHINTSTKTSGDTRFEGLNTGAVITFKVSVKKLTGVSFIQNYTSSVRDNAKNLQYGLQTCKFVRNSLGVIQRASDYLECDGVGYSQIRWYPTIAETFTIEMILEFSEINNFQLHGSTYSGGIFIGQNSSGKHIYVKIFNSLTYSTITRDKPYLSVTYNSVTKLISIYINGVFMTTGTVSNSVTTIPFLLGRTYPNAYHTSKPLRLFKVHNKVLTQAEITKNYNSYVAKGLLT